MKRDPCGKLVRKHLDPRSLVYCALGSSARTWRAQEAPHLSYYGSDPMGIALPAALGLALARPERPVLFIGGDGDLVMGLGCLLTVVGAKPKNFKMLIFDNGRYETGGGQLLAGNGAYSLEAIARGAGFPYAASIGDPARAEAALVAFFAQAGLAFLAAGIDQEDAPYPPAPALAQVEERTLFMHRLAALKD
jgi:thiamine pyrophosphate-dependent acetolactate synthase large subunit-like protein